MSEMVKEFNEYRTRMNEVILEKDNLVIKRYGTSTPILMRRAPLM